MSRNAQKKVLKKRKSLGFELAIGIFLLLGIFAIFFFQSRSSATATNTQQSNHVSTPQLTPTLAIPLARTAPDKVMKQYYADLTSNNFTAAYALLSSDVQQHLDPMGGTMYMQHAIQQLTDKFGIITSYSIITMTKENSQATLTLQIHRANLQSNQVETDIYNLLLEPGGWSIDKWQTHVVTK